MNPNEFIFLDNPLGYSTENIVLDENFLKTSGFSTEMGFFHQMQNQEMNQNENEIYDTDDSTRSYRNNEESISNNMEQKIEDLKNQLYVLVISRIILFIYPNLINRGQYTQLVQNLQKTSEIRSDTNTIIKKELNNEYLQLLDEDEYPFPKYTVVESTIRPYPVMIVNCPSNMDKKDLLIKAEPAPGYKFKLENHISYYKKKDEKFFPKPIGDIIIFELLHILDAGHAEGEKIQIVFSLYNLNSNQSILLAQQRSPPITVYNHSQYLPAPSIVKIVPSWTPANSPAVIDVYGPLFLRKNNILECQITEPNGTIVAKFVGNQIVRSRNCFHSFTIDAPTHGPGRVNIRACYKGRHYGNQKSFEYVQAPFKIEVEDFVFIDPNNDNNNFTNITNESLSNFSPPTTPYSTSEYSMGNGNHFANMMHASYNGNANLLFSILRDNSSKNLINVQDKNGFTALFWACFVGNFDCANLLLKAGANIKITTKFGESVLHAACYSKNALIVKTLLKAGAKVNLIQYEGYTPLHIACYKGDVAIISTLLDDSDLGEDQLSSLDSEGMKPIHLATISGNVAALKLLVERHRSLGEPLFTRDHSGFSPLHWATMINDVDCVREFVKFSTIADINLRDHSGQTALTFAVFNNNFEICRLLLDNNADPNAQDNIKESCLFWAIRQLNNNIVQLLLERGADSLVRNIYGKNAFQSILEVEKKVENTQKQVEKTPNFDDKNKKKSTKHHPTQEEIENLTSELIKLNSQSETITTFESIKQTTNSKINIFYELQKIVERERNYKQALAQNNIELQSLKSTLKTLESEMNELKASLSNKI